MKLVESSLGKLWAITKNGITIQGSKLNKTITELRNFIILNIQLVFLEAAKTNTSQTSSGIPTPAILNAGSQEGLISEVNPTWELILKKLILNSRTDAPERIATKACPLSCKTV
jgi:hypothetical protein